MNFAFYDEIGTPSKMGRVLVPVRRVVRRLMRPVAYRLRDLLQHLSDEQGTMRRDLAVATARQQTAAARLAALEATLSPDLAAIRGDVAELRDQARRQRPLQADYRGLAHRLDRLEESVERLLAAR